MKHEHDEMLDLLQAFTRHRITDAGRIEALEAAGEFLADRVQEFEHQITSETDFREFNGHVLPAHARFRAALEGGENEG